MAQKIVNLTTNNFIPDAESGKLKLSLSKSTLGMSTPNYRLAKFLRETEEGDYKPVVMPYTITSEGDFEALTDEAFSARAIFISDI